MKQEHATGSYSEPKEISPHPATRSQFKIHFNITLSPTLRFFL
jgi:hypothetical protein